MFSLPTGGWLKDRFAFIAIAMPGGEAAVARTWPGPAIIPSPPCRLRSDSSCMRRRRGRRRVKGRARASRWLLVIWAAAGAVLGVPASYYVQSGIVRTFISQPRYTARVLSELLECLSGSSPPDLFGATEAVAATVIATGCLGAFVGICVHFRR